MKPILRTILVMIHVGCLVTRRSREVIAETFSFAGSLGGIRECWCAGLRLEDRRQGYLAARLVFFVMQG